MILRTYRHGQAQSLKIYLLVFGDAKMSKVIALTQMKSYPASPIAVPVKTKKRK
jgi:hypothetical protein